MKRLSLFLAASLASIFLSAPSHAIQPVTGCATGLNAIGGPTEGCILQPQASSAAESSHVFKANGPATVVDFQITNTTASTVWVLLMDATAAPSNGAVTGCVNAASTRPCVAKWYQVSASTTWGITWSPGPFLQLQTGMVLVCSSTGPYTVTLAASCAFSAEVM